MQALPDLTALTSEQKDELICSQHAQLSKLLERINALEARLALNSQNSSKPPSSDGLKKPLKTQSTREASSRSSGGQPGRKGQTLKRVDVPDHVVLHPTPTHCDVCEQALPQAQEGERRQVFDLPPTRFEVTEHVALRTQCSCGKVHVGAFPQHVRASVQIGLRINATMVYLNQHQMIPLQRTTQLVHAFCGIKVSQATVVAANKQACERLKPTVELIKQALTQEGVLGSDESGLRVEQTLYWLHVAVTPDLTHVSVHAKRGMAAFTEIGILENFKGVLVHDGWHPYRNLGCEHALCNAHHLRELKHQHDNHGQAWAGDMMELLRHASHRKNEWGQSAAPQAANAATRQAELGHLSYVYEHILEVGEEANPLAQSTGKKGRVKQSEATNLLGRLREHADDVWRFMSQPEVPFTNNCSEQAVRMPEVKQKISGCFRTLDGAEVFCVIRSYLATLQKQGANLLDALTQTFKGVVPQPKLG
jgi:transposase